MSLIGAWQSLLGRETKASKAGPLLAMQQPGRAVWTPRRFDSFAEEGYRKNVIAFRAINLVTRAAASVPCSSTATKALCTTSEMDRSRRPSMPEKSARPGSKASCMPRACRDCLRETDGEVKVKVG